MIVIEFVGLPASGKSTLASSLKEHLEAAGFPLAVPSSSWGKRLFAKAISLFGYRRAFVAAVKALAVDSRPPSQSWLALRWILATMAARNTVPESGKASVLVQAEGLAQRALLAFLDAQTGEISPLLAQYLGNCPRPDVLVLVVLEPAVSVERQVARFANDEPAWQRNRFQASGSQLSSLMTSAESVLGRAADEFGIAEGVEVVTLDANDLEGAAAALRHQVACILRARTAADGDTA